MNEMIRHTMYGFYVRGIITTNEWNKWCTRYMLNVFLPSPEVREILVRMKNN